MATINLADEGLAPGDVIDPYLAAHAGGSDVVIIPEGTYEWQGEPLDTGTGELLGAGDPGDVVLEHTGGTFRGKIGGGILQNIVVRGSNPQAKSGLYPDDGGTIDEFAWPEGGQQSEDRAIYTSNGGGGRIYITNSAWAGCVNNGAYVDKPPVTIENCVALNNNIANIRVGLRDGSDTSEVINIRNTLVGVTEQIRNDDTNVPHSRGIRLRHPGHLVIENCWFVYRDGFGAADLIELHDGAEGATVEIRNCHFHNETDRDLVRLKGADSAFAVTIEDCTFSGGGSQAIEPTYDGNGVTEDTNVVVPAPSQITGIPQADECYGYSGAAPFGDTTVEEPVDEGPDTSTWNVFEVIARQDGPLNYTFTTDGSVELAATTAGVSAGHGEEITDNGDGTYTVSGYTGGTGNGDAFRIDGTVLDFTADPADYMYDLYMNGDPVTFGDGSAGDGSDEPVDEPVDDSDGTQVEEQDPSTIEETESGWKMIAQTKVTYFDANGRFTTREKFVAERNREIKNE